MNVDLQGNLRSFVRTRLIKISNLFAQPTWQDLACGDCERNAQCGLPPHRDCEYKLLQLSRGGVGRPRRHLA
jgi:hypothetical protein